MQISARHKKFSVEIFLLLLLTVRLIGRSLRQHYTLYDVCQALFKFSFQTEPLPFGT